MIGRLLRRRGADTDLDSAPVGRLLGGGRGGDVPGPRAATAAQLRKAQRLEDPAFASRIAPRRGWAEPDAGQAASSARTTVFRSDTGQASGLYPFLHGASLPAVGPYIGWNTVNQTAFSAHPSAWVAEKVTTNPNVVVTGIPGRGKSALVKALSFRLMAFGHQTLIAGDLKGEYRKLCAALGVEPVRLGPGLAGRVNPLDAGPLGEGLDRILDAATRQSRLAEIHRRRLTLLKALLELQLRRTLLPQEEEGLDLAVREVTRELYGSSESRLDVPTLPSVYQVLKDPSPRVAEELRVRDGDVQTAREQLASLRSALGSMIHGHLGGLFDQRTSVGLDWNAPIQSVDISALQGTQDETIAMVLTCVSSWAQSVIDRPGPPRVVVRDELWRALRSGGTAMVRKVDADLRLSRGEGVIQVLVSHRLSDFEAVGAADSEAAAIGRELIASCDTRIQLAQDLGPLRTIRDTIGLTDAECALIHGWGPGERGRALWKVGKAGSFAVQLMLTPTEEALFETDERMAL
ncbi:type VI secretion protein [Streptomyces sp. NPDC051180]|uniref:type VI secretion protein n=1 Tax=unclassified Streptomyces TaxID=2593676 RepID=UPI00344CD78D